MDGTRGYYRVLPLGRTVPHIHRVYNIIWTSGETAAQSWYTPLRQGGIYPAKYLATSGPYHNPQSPFYYPVLPHNYNTMISIEYYLFYYTLLVLYCNDYDLDSYTS